MEGGAGAAMREGRKKGNRLSAVMILAGCLLIAGVLAREAFLFPWATVFGGDQTDSAVADPPPISWEGGQAVPSAPSAALSVLPGNESGNGPAGRYTELGILKIPILHLSQHVLEGTQGRQMRVGVGHVSGTAPIGGAGNCAVAGHNTTSFRYLSRLSAGDTVLLKANGKVFTYRVFQTFTVGPAQTEVLNRIPGESAALTLITCTPYLTGTHRLIVRARLTKKTG